MSALKNDLLARGRFDGPDRVVGPAESDLGAVGRPGNSVNGVERDRHGKLKFPLGYVPNLHFAEGAGVAARNRKLLAVGRKGERLNALRQAHEACL